jgi:hypothetical protein
MVSLGVEVAAFDELVLVLVVLMLVLDVLAGLTLDVLVFAVLTEDGELVPRHVTLGVPAERYQLAFGSPRQVPTVTEVPYPSAAIALRMNSVKLYTV